MLKNNSNNLKISNKEKYLKITLYIISTVLFFLWGLTHIFLKEFYFNNMFGVAFNINDHFDNEASEMIGVLCIALAYGAFLAAKNPSQNINMIKVLIISAIGGASVFSWNILIGRAPVSLLFNVVVIIAMVVVIITCYPKSNKKNE